jgi:hypothetical protein
MAVTEHTGRPVRIDYNHEWEGRNGPVHDFDIEFEDGTIGQFSTTKRDQTKFVLNKEVKYTATTRSGNFGPKIDVAKDPNAGRGGSGGGRSSGNTGGRGMSPEVEASITMSVCLDAAATCILKTGKADKVTEDLVPLHSIANKFFKHIMTKSAGDRQLSINYQSRLKEVVGILMDYNDKDGNNLLGIKSTDDVLKYVDLEVAFLQLKMNESK